MSPQLLLILENNAIAQHNEVSSGFTIESLACFMFHLFSLADMLSLLKIFSVVNSGGKKMKMFRGAVLGILLWSVLFAVWCLTSTVSNCGNSSAPMAVNTGVQFLPQKYFCTCSRNDSSFEKNYIKLLRFPLLLLSGSHSRTGYDYFFF